MVDNKAQKSLIESIQFKNSLGIMNLIIVSQTITIAAVWLNNCLDTFYTQHTRTLQEINPAHIIIYYISTCNNCITLYRRCYSRIIIKISRHSNHK